MKIVTLILIISLLQVSAASRAQRLTIVKNNVTLTEVFKEIKKQTGYSVLIRSGDLIKSKQINLNLKNVAIDDAVKQILSGQNLSYAFQDNVILIKKDYSTLLRSNSPLNEFIDIQGLVLDEMGNAMAGAIVRVKGTKKFVPTDEKGRFSLPDVTKGDVLTISYIGYKLKELVIGDVNNITITLLPTEAELEGVEVVSTGYQTLPKERATGSFNVISKEQLDKPATNISQRLIGTTAGLVSSPSGFRIRGLSTLTTNATGVSYSSPLIVLDGFPLEGTSFNEINPNNVESITILKDAAAASIWGSRSANGVIVITTKSGKKGIPFTADVNAFTRIGNKLDLDYSRPLASSSETVEYEQLAFGKWNGFYNSGSLNLLRYGPHSQASSLMNEYRLGRITLQQRDEGLALLSNQDNSKQIRDLILDNPVSTQVNLNLTGGTTRTTQALSALFENNTTNFQGTDNKRTMLNYRMTANIAKWLDFDMGALFQYQKSNNNGFTLQDINQWSRYDMLLNEDGSQFTKFPMGYYMPSLDILVDKSKFPYDFYYNPIRERNARDYTTERLNGRVQAALRATIIEGLTVSSSIQYENNNSFLRNIDGEDSFVVRSSVNNSISFTPAGVQLNLPLGAQMDQERTKGRGYNFRNMLNFNRTIANEHAVSLVAGMELSENITETFIYAKTYGYNGERLTAGQFPNGPNPAQATWLGGFPGPFPYTNSFLSTKNNYYSVFSNLAYTYRGKYTLSGSYRTDAANFIAATSAARYSPFWSVGGLWNASKEDFLKNTTWLDKLSLRLTYGVNGNEDRSTSPYPLVDILSDPDLYTGETIGSILNYGNPNLRWEKTSTVNAGIDFSVFKGKLYGSVEAYRKEGRDLLGEVSIPIVNGTGVQKLNNVEMYNRGIEFNLGSSLEITKDIRWRGNVNFAYNDNKITKLFRALYNSMNLASTSALGLAYVEGQNANTLWSYRYGGLVNDNPTYLGPNNQPVNFGNILGSDARSWMQNSGVTVAPYNIGITNSFDLYNFSLSAIVTGKFGHVFRRSGFNYPAMDGRRILPNARLSEILNGEPSQVLTLPASPTYPNYSRWSIQYPSLDYLVANANHIRLQEINLSYNIPSELMKRIGFSALRLYAQGNNLLVITNNKYDEDPEYRMGSFTLNPRPTYTFGLKLQF